MSERRNRPPALQAVVVEKVGSPEQLRERVSSLHAAAVRKLGLRLLELELVTEEQLERALRMQVADPSLRLGHVLVDLGYVSEPHLAQVVCDQLGIPFADLGCFPIDPEVLPLLPVGSAVRYGMLPLCRLDSRLCVAMTDPLDVEALEQARFCARMAVLPVMALRRDVYDAIGKAYVYDVVPYTRDSVRQECAVYAVGSPRVRRSRRTRGGTPRRASRLPDGSPRAKGLRSTAAAGSARGPC